MKLRRLLRLLLAAALLAAWQGALLHPIEHIDRAGQLVHVAGTTHDPNEDGGPSALCDAIAAVAGCVGEGPKQLIVPPAGGESVAIAAAGEPRGSPPRYYSSRAPPSLL